MQKNIFKALFCCLFIVSCFLGFGTACGKEKSQDYEYESTSYNLRVEEKDATFVTSLQNVVIYHGEHANYYFDKNLSPELRDTYVTTSEQVMQFLVENTEFAGTLEVYAADGMYYYNTETEKCALGTEYAGTSVQAALLIQAATNSATANYGLLQAEGFSVAKLFGWDISYVPPIAIANNEDFAHPLTGKRYELTKADELQDDYLAEDVFSILGGENNFLLDLEYLCFSPNYVAEEQVEYAWRLTRSLSGYISANAKEQEVLQLLMRSDDLISFEEKFAALKNAWLENIGSNVRVSAKEYPVHYGNYGRFALFQMETLHGKWYVRSSFDTSIQGGGEFSWIFHRDYQTTDMWMQQFESELAHVDEILRDKTYDYPELSFYLERNDSRGNVGGYYDDTHQDRVYINYLYSVVHEYCHYLMLQDGLFIEDGVRKEVYVTQLHLLPYYYGAYSEISYLLFQELYEVTKEYHANEEGWDDYFRKFEEKFDGEVLICDGERMGQFMHFLIALEGMYRPLSKTVSTSGVYGYQEEADVILYSFSIYIADTYGEDVLYLVATGNDKVKELTGHTYEELAEEWEAYLEKSYGFGKK